MFAHKVRTAGIQVPFPLCSTPGSSCAYCCRCRSAAGAAAAAYLQYTHTHTHTHTQTHTHSTQQLFSWSCLLSSMLPLPLPLPLPCLALPCLAAAAATATTTTLLLLPLAHAAHYCNVDRTLLAGKVRASTCPFLAMPGLTLPARSTRKAASVEQSTLLRST